MKTAHEFIFDFCRKVIIGFILLLTIGLAACQSTTSESNNKQENAITKIPSKYEVAKQFINAYVDYCNDRSTEISLLDWVKNQETVSVDFKVGLEEIITEAELLNPDLGLEFDPIFEAQDFPSSFEIESYEGEYVTVIGQKFPDFKLVMKVVEKNGRWLVDGSGIVNIPEEKRKKR